jgi:hypothetical protein
MIFFLLLSMSGPVITISGTGTPLVAEDYEGTIGAIACTHFMDDSLYMISSRRLGVVAVDAKAGTSHHFSRKGQGPGELSDFVQVLWSIDGTLFVSHASGNRLERFSLDGALLGAERHGRLVFSSPYGRVEKSGDDFLIRQKESRMAVPGFEASRYQTLFEAVAVGDFLMLASNQARDDTFQLVSINLKTGETDREERMKIWPNHKNGLPSEVMKMLRLQGIKQDRFFARSIRVLAGHPDHGVFFVEYTLHERPEGETALWHYRPESGDLVSIRLLHEDLFEVEMVQPVSANMWIVFADDRLRRVTVSR